MLLENAAHWGDKIRQDAWGEGWDEGKAKGQEEERLAVARRLLSKKYSLDTVSCATGLSPEEIRKLGFTQ